jgi:hypothetical protein
VYADHVPLRRCLIDYGQLIASRTEAPTGEVRRTRFRLT